MSTTIYKKLRNKLQVGDILYTTRYNRDFTFVRWDTDGSLRFNIPSREPNKKGSNKKIEQEVIEGKVKPEFKDCRLSVFKNIFNQ